MSNRLKKFIHKDTQDTEWEILFWGTSGLQDLTVRSLARPFFTLSYEGDRIKRSRLDVNVMVRTDDDLVDEENLEWVVLYKNGDPYWYGVPHYSANEVKEGDYPYVRTYSFKDPILEGALPLEDIQTYTSLAKIIAKYTGYTLDIVTYDAWEVNIPGLGGSNPLFDRMYFDEWNFRDVQDGVEDEADDIPLSAEEILTQILTLFDAYLIQADYKWRVVQYDVLPRAFDALAFGQYSTYEFDSNGDLKNGITPSFVDTSYTVDQENLYIKPTSTSYRDRTYVQAVHRYKHRAKDIPPIRYNRYGFTLFPGESNVKETEYRASNLGGSQFYLEFKLSAQPGTIYFSDVKAIPQVTIQIDDAYYWSGEIWTSNATSVDVPLVGGVATGGDAGYYRTNFEGEVKIKTAPIPTTGNLKITIEPLTVEGNDVITFFQDIVFSVITDASDDDANGRENSEEITYSLTVLDFVTPPVSKRGDRYTVPDLIIGDGPNELGPGRLLYKFGSVYVRVTNTGSIKWQRKYRLANEPNLSDGPWPGEISLIQMRSILDRYKDPAKILRADLIGEYSPERLLENTIDGKSYAFERGRLRGQDGEWNIYGREVRENTQTTNTYSFNTNNIGFVPGVFAPVQYKNSNVVRRQEIVYETIKIGKGAIDEDGFITGASFGSGGGAAKTVNNNPIPDGSILYNTEPGDTLPYFYQNLQRYQNINVFRTSTDSWTASSGQVTLVNNTQRRNGALDETGVLIAQFNADVVTTQEFGIEKALVDQEFTGYFKCDVYLPNYNGATQGVKIVAGTESDSTLTTEEWVTLEVLNRDQAKVEILGTDVYGNTVYNQDFEDEIRVRNVTFIGNVFESTGGIIEMFDATLFDWREDADILIAKEISTGDIVNFGFVTNIDGSGAPISTTNEDYGLDGTYQIIGRWLKTIRSISGDVITTGTINAGLVSITNLDTSGTQVIRSETEPTERPDTTNLQGGDIWINTATNEGDRIYTWNPYPIEQWVESMTAISGDNIVTGTLDASLVTITNFAGAGNITIRSTSQPTTRPDSSALVEGDIWVDTDDGNRPRVWNGSSWSELLTAISGSNIVTGTIDASLVTISNFTVDVDDVTGAVVVIRSDTEPTTRVGGAALEEGDIWIDTYNGDAPYSYDGADFVAQFTQIDGNNIITGSITANKLDVTNLEAVATTTGALTVNNTLTMANGSSISGDNYTFTKTGGNIANWIITTNVLKSSGGGGAYIELNNSDERIQIKDASNNPLVAMGFLDGLAKNDGSGYWGAGVYGFWAKAGSKIEIDGDVEYEDGDFIIQSNGAVKSQNYSAGTAGFIINGDGDAEFNDVTVRGAIVAGANSAVDGQYIDDGTIVAAKIAAGTITATEIATGTITATQIEAATITSAEIATGTITTGNIQAAAITSSLIAANTITASNIAAGTITADEIATGTITALQLDSNSVTADKINVTNLQAVSATMGALTINDTLTMTTGAIEFSGTSGGMEIKKVATNTGGILGNESLRIDGRRVEIRGTGGSVYALQADEAGYVSIADSTSVQLGFFGSQGQTKNTVTGSRGGNAALASLLTALANYGLITDSST